MFNLIFYLNCNHFYLLDLYWCIKPNKNKNWIIPNMNLEPNAVKAKSQNLAKFIKHIKGIDSSASKISKIEEELASTKHTVDEIWLTIRKEMVSITRLDIVKIMIDNEVNQQAKERVQTVDPVQIKDILRRIDLLEKSDAKYVQLT